MTHHNHMTTETENRSFTHLAVWPNGDTRKVVLLNDDGEIARVRWRERHQPIPGQGFFVDLEEFVSIEFLVPIYGWEGDEG